MRYNLLIGRMTAILTCSILTSCATVDRGSVAASFSAAAHGAQDAFTTARTAEADAFLDEAIAQQGSGSRITTSGCLYDPTVGMNSVKDCKTIIFVNGVRVSVEPVGKALAEDVGKLTAYADGLAIVAEAKDLDQRQAGIRKLSSAIGDITSAVGVPGIAAIGNLLADALRAHEVSERRKKIALIAESVDPSVQLLAAKMSTTLGKLRENIVLARSQNVSDLNTQYISLPAADSHRQAIARSLILSTEAERRASAVSSDLTSLGTAHRKLITSMRDNSISVGEVYDAISQFADDADAIRTALSAKGK